MNNISTAQNKKPLVIPDGFQAMLEALARDVLLQQPNDVEQFAASFFR